MNSDLLFPIIPRDNRVLTPQEEAKVREVDKGPKMRALNDEEQELKAEERDAREKQKGESNNHSDQETINDEQIDEQTLDPESVTEDDDGKKHIDCYI